MEAILEAAEGKEIIICLDGNVPCEQMVTAAAWCDAWDRAKLSLVIEPADRELLMGTDTSGAEYLCDESLADCDGFVIVGDVFAANPMCSRGVFDRRKAAPRTPVVVIDPAAGSASKFATHRVDVSPGMELEAVAALASSAGVDVGNILAGTAGQMPSGVSAGAAISKCRRLGVLVAAEYARCATWRQIGYLAGLLAKARGGGVAPQTTGTNALSAVRLEGKLNTIPLAEAMAKYTDPSGGAALVAIGCDVLGMLGWADREVLAAAAALPNCTTDAAKFILPTTMVGEFTGTYLLSGDRRVEVAPALKAPAGLLDPAKLTGALAAAAGVSLRGTPSVPEDLERVKVDIPPGAVETNRRPPTTALLFGRDAIHSGCGELSGHGSWSEAVQPKPLLRLAPHDAKNAGTKNLDDVLVRCGGRYCGARVRIAPELPPGVMVLPEGVREVRALSAYSTNGKVTTGLKLTAAPRSAEVVK